MKGDRQRLKGAVNEAVGKTTGSAGHAAGSKKTEAKAAAKVLKGKTQQTIGKARSRARTR